MLYKAILYNTEVSKQYLQLGTNRLIKVQNQRLIFYNDPNVCFWKSGSEHKRFLPINNISLFKADLDLYRRAETITQIGCSY